MADSVREKIQLNILATLLTITTANGYVNDVALAERWKQDGNSFVSLPAIIIHGGSEDASQPDTQLDHNRMSVVLDVRVKTELVATDGPLNSLLADIKKAMAQDITRGSNAQDTSYRRTEVYVPPSGISNAAMLVEFEIFYRHSFTDPTTPR